MKTIYLCGGIKDLSVKDQTEWRDSATSQLYPRFKILNPMRRNFRDDEFQSQNEIVNLDKADIMESDIILVNGTKPSWGTSMEILFAFIKHKNVVVFTGTEYKDVSPWVAFHATRICKTMDEAIKYIKTNF